MSNELTLPQRAAVALASDKTRADLEALVKKSAAIHEIKNKAGRDECHGAAMALVKARTTIQKIAKDARDDATKFSKAVIEEERALIGITAAEEARLMAIRDEWDAKVEAEKKAKEEAERKAAALIRERIDGIRGIAVQAGGMDSAGIALLIEDLKAVEIGLDEFGDLAGEAAQAKQQTLERLDMMHDHALEGEAEAARLAEEKAELARQRAEQEAREKAERERIAEQQRIEAEKLRAERAEFERQQAEAREAARQQEERDRARRDEEDRKAREARAAEDKRIADARAALEAEQRAVREAKEAKEAAARQAELDRLDAEAAAERQRLDDEAAELRAKQQREADEARAKAQAEAKKAARAAAKLAAAQKAGPRLLAAMKEAEDLVANRWGYPDDASSRVSILAEMRAAIAEGDAA